MCAITGVYSSDGKAALYARNILHFLQNRGQDTAGVYTLRENGKVDYRKGEGKVLEVFGRLLLPDGTSLGNVHKITQFAGNNAVGHTRYQTTERGGPYNAQPFSTKNQRYTVIMSHNGHVNNFADVAESLNLEDRIREDKFVDQHPEVKIDCDVTAIMYVFADGLQKSNDPVEGIMQGAENVMKHIRGAYTVSAAVHDNKTGKTYQVAFKDPRGIRPGFFGQQNGSFAIASETYALERTHFWNIKPIKNAEVVIFDGKETIRRQIEPFSKMEYLPCQFEPGYFSRALSCLDGRSINHGRFMEGLALARKIMHEKPEWADIIDFVTYIPHTPMPISKGLAKGLDKDFRVTIEKDLYDYKREFIALAETRHKKTKDQSYVHWDAVCGRNFILTDDSIVRGDTMKENIAMLRFAGAVNIYVASGYPRIEYPCDLGVDMKTHEELIAHGRTDEQIAKDIGADGLIFLSQPEYAHSWDTVDIDAGIRRKIELGIFSPEILEFVSNGKRCNACVTGKNPTHD